MALLMGKPHLAARLGEKAVSRLAIPKGGYWEDSNDYA